MTIEPRPESERIGFLLERDGPKATAAWVERTLAIYRQALTDPRNYANDPSYKPLFERAVRELEEWLGTGSPGSAQGKLMPTNP